MRHPTSPDPLTIGTATIAVVAMSSSAPLIAFAAGPALAIAFWRNGLAVVVLAPFALLRRRAEFRSLVRGAGRRTGLYCVLAGLALAIHFATWMPSAKLTSVATASALVATQPVWQGLIALGQGRRQSALAWLGIAVAVLGAALATGADFGLSARAVAGDLLALAGAIAGAVYTALGERARLAVSTVTYTSICYGVCALGLLLVCLVGGVPLIGFDATTWIAILGLVAGAQLLGHSMVNYVLRKMSATSASIMMLLQVPVAALIAWIWLGQTPQTASLPGLALLLVGVAIVVVGKTRDSRNGPGVDVGQ